MKLDETSNSANLAMWYKSIHFTFEDLKKMEGTVTKECWKYLVGKFCAREREKRNEDERVRDIYTRIGDTLGYAEYSLRTFFNYAKSIDRIHKYWPHIAENILNGNVRISAADTIALAKLNSSSINNVILRISSEKTQPRIIIDEQRALQLRTDKRGRSKQAKNEAPHISVKDMPAYDPDAPVNGLTYTIPSWISMIERTFSAADLSEASSLAKDKLTSALSKLAETVSTLVLIISEVN